MCHSFGEQRHYEESKTKLLKNTIELIKTQQEGFGNDFLDNDAYWPRSYSFSKKQFLTLWPDWFGEKTFYISVSFIFMISYSYLHLL